MASATGSGLREELDRLLRLIEDGHVEEARRLVSELAARWPDSREIRHLARVLEPPQVIPSAPGPRGRRFDRDHAWLREHAHEYPGCWIATLGDRLIAADPSAERVLGIVQSSTDVTSELPLLHYQPVSTE